MIKLIPILSVPFFLASAGVFATGSSTFDDLQSLGGQPTTREFTAPPPPNGEPAFPDEEPSEPPMPGEVPVAPPPPTEEITSEDLPVAPPPPNEEITSEDLPVAPQPPNEESFPPVDEPVPLSTPPPSSEGRAINISIGSNGGGLDMSVVRTVRQVIGHALAQGTIGTFVDIGNREGAPIPVEGGFTFCVEMTFSPSFGDTNTDGWVKLDSEFANFYSDLKSIHPRIESTFYNVEWVSECQVIIEDYPNIIPPPSPPPPVDGTDPDDGVVCTQDAMFCPDGSFVVREPPSCEFQDCLRLEIQD